MQGACLFLIWLTLQAGLMISPVPDAATGNAFLISLSVANVMLLISPMLLAAIVLLQMIPASIRNKLRLSLASPVWLGAGPPDSSHDASADALDAGTGQATTCPSHAAIVFDDNPSSEDASLSADGAELELAPWTFRSASALPGLGEAQTDAAVLLRDLPCVVDAGEWVPNARAAQPSRSWPPSLADLQLEVSGTGLELDAPRALAARREEMAALRASQSALQASTEQQGLENAKLLAQNAALREELAAAKAAMKEVNGF